MDPVTIAALIGGATSAIQGIAGLFQQNKAKKLEDQYPRPVATVSPAIKKLTGYAFARTLDQDLPGGELYRNEIKGATSAGIRAASELGSGAEAYGLLGRLNQNQNASFAELAKLTAQQVRGAQGQYMDVLAGPQYQEERRVDYWNNEMPYLQAAQTAQQLRWSGGQNLMASAKNIGGVATEALTPDLYEAIYGTNRGRAVNKKQLSEEDITAAVEKILKSSTYNSYQNISNGNINYE